MEGAEELDITSVNRVQVYGQDKYLVLKEIKPIGENHLTKNDIKCDVVCLVFDSSQSCSFEYCAHVYLVGVIFVQIKPLASFNYTFLFAEILSEQKHPSSDCSK